LDLPVFAQDGYVMVYVSNESDVLNYVHFDDFRVYHAKTNVVSATNYYAYGATFGEFVRTASVSQPFKYQSKEWQTDLGLNLIDNEWRQYDPFTVRTTTHDPHSENYYSYSGYSWVGGNPIMIIDPDGRDILFWKFVGDGEGEGEWKKVSFKELDKKVQKAIVNFVKTDAGKEFFGQFAKEGDKIGNVEFTENGKYSKHNLNLGEYVGRGSEGYVGNPIPHDGKGPVSGTGHVDFYVNMSSSTLNDSEINFAETLGHEVFLHLNQYLDKYIEAFERGGSREARKVHEQHQEGNYLGYRDHFAMANRTPASKAYYIFVEQLKRIFNPQDVNKHIEAERSKNKRAAERQKAESEKK
jgi:RHS repeat-associated protein